MLLKSFTTSKLSISRIKIEKLMFIIHCSWDIIQSAIVSLLNSIENKIETPWISNLFCIYQKYTTCNTNLCKWNKFICLKSDLLNISWTIKSYNGEYSIFLNIQIPWMSFPERPNKVFKNKQLTSIQHKEKIWNIPNE